MSHRRYWSTHLTLKSRYCTLSFSVRRMTDFMTLIHFFFSTYTEFPQCCLGTVKGVKKEDAAGFQDQELFHTYLKMTIFTVQPRNWLFFLMCSTAHPQHIAPENADFYFRNGSDRVTLWLCCSWPAILMTQTGFELFIPYYLEIKRKVKLNISFSTKNHPTDFKETQFYETLLTAPVLLTDLDLI